MAGWHHGKCACCGGSTGGCGWSCSLDDLGVQCQYKGNESGVATYFLEEIPGPLDFGPSIDPAYYQDQWTVDAFQFIEGDSITFRGPDGYTSGAAPHGYLYADGRPRAYISCIAPQFPYPRRLRGGIYNAMPTLERWLTPNGSRRLRINIPSGIGTGDAANSCRIRGGGGAVASGVLISTCCWFFGTSCPTASTDGQAAIVQLFDGNRTISRRHGIYYEDFRLTNAECHPSCATQTIPSPSQLPFITGI